MVAEQAETQDRSMERLAEILREKGYFSVVVCEAEKQNQLTDDEWNQALERIEQKVFPEGEGPADYHVGFRCQCLR